MATAKQQREIRRIRIHAGLRSCIALVLAVAVFVVANLLSLQLFANWRYADDGSEQLSSRAIEIVNNINGNLEIYSVFERYHPYRIPAERLLRDFSEMIPPSVNRRITTRSLNANIDIVETEALMRRYPIKPNSILIIHGHKYRILDEFDLARQPAPLDDAAPDAAPDSDELPPFRGEQACIFAILSLTRPFNSSVYFLAGHGEFDPFSQNPITGASILRQALTRNGFVTKPLLLADAAAIPEDASLIVVAGPRTMLSQQEIERLASFLSNGGRVLFLIDNAFANGLLPLFSKWGIQIDASAGRIPGNRTKTVSTLLYGEHMITSRLENILCAFSSPCSISKLRSDALQTDRGDKPSVTELVFIPAPATDSASGPLSIAVTSELGADNRSERPNAPRLVVIGDSDFISNSSLGAGNMGNALLFLSSVEWLTGFRKSLAQPESFDTLQTKTEPLCGWKPLALHLCVGVPLAICAFGLFFWIPIVRRL